MTAALTYHKRGFSVIPIQAREKKPLVAWEEYQKRGATEDEIRSWWSKWPDANVGIVTGAVCGLVVIDLDTAEAKEKFKELVPRYDCSAVPDHAQAKAGRYFLSIPDLPARIEQESEETRVRLR